MLRNELLFTLRHSWEMQTSSSFSFCQVREHPSLLLTGNLADFKATRNTQQSIYEWALGSVYSWVSYTRLQLLQA